MKRIILITSLIFVLSAPLTYFIIFCIDKVLLPNFPWIIIEGSKDAWISFFANIFSGIITMLALFITIKHENISYNREQTKLIRPFIVATPLFEKEFMNSVHENSCFYPISFRVENISNNLVKDLQIVDEQVYEYNPTSKKYDLNQQVLLSNNQTHYSIFTVLLESRTMIKPLASYDFQTNFLIDDYSVTSESSAHSFKVFVILKYRDIMDKVEYTHKVEYELFINYTNTGNFILFTDNIQNTLLEEKKLNL